MARRTRVVAAALAALAALALLACASAGDAKAAKTKLKEVTHKVGVCARARHSTAAR